MSGAEWLRVVGVLAGLFLGMPLIRILAKQVGASPEVARKTIHVAMGLVCATFPWVFDRPLPVWILAAVATVPLAVIRALPALRAGVGSALHGVDRPSYGEVLFAPAVATVFAISGGDAILYLVPVLILTIADAAGALVGTRWGKRRYGAGGGFKTVEGSIIFCLTAFACAALTLYFGGRVDGEKALWIGLILALLAMMAEGFSDRGFDNLVIPLGCCLILERLIELESGSLVGRFIVLVLIFVVVVAGSKWSTLNGGALLGSVLLGYGCAVIADWRFALPPLAVFICHLATTKKYGLVGHVDHRLDAVLSHCLACMPWVVGTEAGWVSPTVGLAGVSFAMGAQLALLDTATCLWLRNGPLRPIRATFKGLIIAMLPGLICLWMPVSQLALPVGLAMISTLSIVLIFPKIQAWYRGHVTGLWLIKGYLSLLASGPAILLIQ